MSVRLLIIFLFVLAIWEAVAFDVKANSANAETIAEDDVGDKDTLRGRRGDRFVEVAELATAMKTLERENTQITEANRQQELAIGQLQLQVSQLSTNTMKLQEESEKLRAQLRSTHYQSAGAIGFHARLLSSIRTPVTQTLVVNKVEYNSGGGYNPITGVFTAPVTGLYLFLANMAADASGKEAWIEIVLGDRGLCRAWSRYSTEIELASCHAAIRVVKGQMVKIVANGMGNGQIRGGEWTTFTGVLIQRED